MKVEGKNAVTELFRSNTKIDKILIQNTQKTTFFQIIDLAKRKNVKVNFVPKEVLDRESQVKNHQGIIAFVGNFIYSSVEDMFAVAKERNEEPFFVLIDEVADPHNLGSLIRTCECAGVHGIIIPKNRSVLVNETVVKVSTGATAYVKIAKVVNISKTIEFLKEQNIFVYALEKGGDNLYDQNLTGPIAFVVGSEGQGIRALNKKVSDKIISIPEFGKINSLNASVATAVTAYEIRRQRGRK